MADNVIVLENQRTDGVMSQSYWDVPHSKQIEGFATQISVNVGDTVDFKINVNGNAGSDYNVEIFRLGYYGGEGARKVSGWTNDSATVQPEADYDPTLGLVDAGNWSVTDSWDVPEDAVSGVYLARLQRLDADGNPIEGAVNQIPFIIRDDDREADIVLQTSDTTWHAYNGWFGNNGKIGANLYGDASGTVDHPDIPGERTGGFEDRAYAVSYNRPFITRGIEGEQGGPLSGAQDYLFGADYAAIHWLEKNGYDISYISGVDTDRMGADYLTKYQAFISVGHDEYWSGGQRENVEAAREAGVNLLFWGGNDIYWKTRWETSEVDGVEYRTLVCYKETWANTNPNAGPADYVNLDPADIWTGTWRDIRFQANPLAGYPAPNDGISGQPHTCNCAENALSGQLFGPDGTGEFGGALDVPAQFAPLRVWRDTSIADGGALGIAPGLIGYEWNTSPDDPRRPAGLIHLSESTIDWNGILVDQGNATAPGTATHNLSLYRAESGALVFGAGTVFWTWALSDKHDGSPYDASIENADLQQFVINLFADMGIQPGVADLVLASQGLVRAAASEDEVAATATINDLPDTVPEFGIVTISGTATDNDGNAATDDGVVALVELSFDGGKTWNVATGTTNWTYSWLATGQQTYDIRVRAIDDSLNLPTASTLDRQIVEVVEPETPDSISLFIPWTTPNSQFYQESGTIHLGTRFSATQAGQITELRYWRDPLDSGDTDIRTGRLWNADGTLMGVVQFTSAPGESGWQVAELSIPVNLIAGLEYIVSYETQNNYVATQGFFTNPHDGPFGYLMAAGGANGVFGYGAGNIMPTRSYLSSNYWVDVGFSPTTPTGGAPVFSGPASFSIAENTLLAAMIAATDPDADTVTYSIGGGKDANRFSINAATGALIFDFAPDYDNPADSDGDNVYEVIIRAHDGNSGPVTQAITIAVTDETTEIPHSTLFGAGEAPTYVETGDSTSYELGTILQARQWGQVAALRYWRGTADAGDTDARTLNLWTAGGVLLASATVVSAAGDDGWQTAILDAPVTLDPRDRYVVSYGTTQNYAATPNYFSSAQTGPDGVLSSPVNGGVFGHGRTGIFPTVSWQGTNYWVDAVFVPMPQSNEAPTFVTVDTSFSITENRLDVATFSAFDPDGDTLVFAISGGEDAGLLRMNATTGALTFADLPDFENPLDADGDGIYELQISVSDGTSPAILRDITVTVTDQDPETVAFSLFNASQSPDQIVTNDPTAYELGVRFISSMGGDLTELRYWRGNADAFDTDIRTLNLWDQNGVLLTSVTVQSNPGATGWQSGILDSAVELTPGALYVASYGTTQNYAFTSNYFAEDRTDSSGMLTAPSAGGNGVFRAGSTGLFPNATYNASNYWVDIVIEPTFDI